MTQTTTALPVRQHYIDGGWVDAASGETFESINPATAEATYLAARGGTEDVARAVKAAKTAFEAPTWRDTTATARGKLLRRLGDLIGENAETLARAEVLDNGKLWREMVGQLRALPEWYYYYAGLADKVHGDVIPGLRTDVLTYTLREPLGVIGAITPWNSPLLLTSMKLAPALAAGNTMVIKPSEHTSASLLDLMPLVAEAGIPDGVVNVVTGFGTEAGAALVDHPDVSKIAFTGGSVTGRKIAAACGDRLIRVTLELGGKSPQLVFADADPQSAAMGVIAGIYGAAGQTCIAGSRVFLHESIQEEVLGRIEERARRIVIGDPLDPATEMGPVAFRAQLEKIEGYVAIGREEGATLRFGGGRPEGFAGYYHEPTLFQGATNQMRIAREEIFGPVATAITFRDEEEALKLANDTGYGLASGIWTRDLARAHRLAARLDAGVVWINMYRALWPMVPFGGFKQSGIGKENGFSVMHEYTREKAVWVNMNDEPTADPFVLR